MKKCIIFIGLVVFSCNRLYIPPKPPNVSEKALYIHRLHQWYYSDDFLELVWYANGSLYKKIEKKNNVYHGLYQVYFRNGQISQMGKYEDGYRVGKWYYYFPNGNIYLLISYQKEPYDPTIFHINSSFGNENGQYIRYYIDNTIEEVGFYLAGKLHGKRTRYYKNGKKHFEIQYQNGNKQGIAKYYDYQGNLKKMIEYKENTVIFQKVLH